MGWFRSRRGSETAASSVAVENGIPPFVPTNCPCRRLAGTQLAEGERHRVEAHFLGHVLDFRAGGPDGISMEGIEYELRVVYDDLHNPQRRAQDASGNLLPRSSGDATVFPEKLGIRGKDIRAELMAEALRAYLQDPNYLNAVAPNVAYRIRDVVNTHPEISKIIVFN